MNKYNFDVSINRKSTHSYRWNVSDNELPLDIADMDFKVMPEIAESIKARADQSCYGYTYVPEEYFKAYISWWENRHDTRLELEWFIFSNSVVGSLDSIFKHLGNKNEQVVMFTPIYNVFFNCIKNNHLVLKECSLLLKEDKYEIDWDKLEKLLKEAKTKFFLLCNPHNPVGRGFTSDEINRIVNLCKENDIYLISDEIHADINYNKGQYISLFNSLGRAYEKSILLLSPGKTFNLAGLHSSVVVIANEELRNIVKQGLEIDDLGEPNYFAVDPVITAYTRGAKYVNQLNSYLNENKAFLSQFLAKNLPNIKIIGGEFTYLLWLDISCYYKDSNKFVKDLRFATGLVLASGLNYGKEGQYFVRINIATTRDNIIDACNRLLKFISQK